MLLLSKVLKPSKYFIVTFATFSNGEASELLYAATFAHVGSVFFSLQYGMYGKSLDFVSIWLTRR